MIDEKKFWSEIDVVKDRPNGFTKTAKFLLYLIAIVLGVSIAIAIIFMFIK